MRPIELLRDGGPRRPGRLHVLPCHAVLGFAARLRGLLGHPPPSPGMGWWFPQCQAVHTVGMRYDIDVVFLCAAGRVLRVVSRLPPARGCWQRGAAHVVELAAGQAERLDLRMGERVCLWVLPPGGTLDEIVLRDAVAQRVRAMHHPAHDDPCAARGVTAAGCSQSVPRRATSAPRPSRRP